MNASSLRRQKARSQQRKEKGEALPPPGSHCRKICSLLIVASLPAIALRKALLRCRTLRALPDSSWTDVVLLLIVGAMVSGKADPTDEPIVGLQPGTDGSPDFLLKPIEIARDEDGGAAIWWEGRSLRIAWTLFIACASFDGPCCCCTDDRTNWFVFSLFPIRERSTSLKRSGSKVNP